MDINTGAVFFTSVFITRKMMARNSYYVLRNIMYKGWKFFLRNIPTASDPGNAGEERYMITGLRCYYRSFFMLRRHAF